MSHIWMSHVTHVNESCHTNDWVMHIIEWHADTSDVLYHLIRRYKQHESCLQHIWYADTSTRDTLRIVPDLYLRIIYVAETCICVWYMLLVSAYQVIQYITCTNCICVSFVLYPLYYLYHSPVLVLLWCGILRGIIRTMPPMSHVTHICAVFYITMVLHHSERCHTCNIYMLNMLHVCNIYMLHSSEWCNTMVR